jgi:Fur family ferric uptake transcriptional regulator
LRATLGDVLIATSPDAADLLRSRGLRATTPRVAILMALARHPHTDTETVVGHVREDLASVSRQSIYDGLNALTAVGLVRRFQPQGSVARYEINGGDNHHHLVCRECGVIVDAECATGVAPCLDAADDAGFEIDEAEVIFWGMCPSCKAIRERDERGVVQS